MLRTGRGLWLTCRCARSWRQCLLSEGTLPGRHPAVLPLEWERTEVGHVSFLRAWEPLGRLLLKV